MRPPDPVTMQTGLLICLENRLQSRSERPLVRANPVEDVLEDRARVAPGSPGRSVEQARAIRDVHRNVPRTVVGCGRHLDLVAGDLRAQTRRLEQRERDLTAAASV